MKNNFKLKILFASCLIIFLFLLAGECLAVSCAEKYPSDGKCAVSCEKTAPEDKTSGLCPSGQTCCHTYATQAVVSLQVPIFSYTTARGLAEYIGKIYEYSLYVLVPLAIIIIIYAGLRWMFAGGDMPKIKEAKKYITGAVMGLIIALLSGFILSLVGITEIKLPQIGEVASNPIEATQTGSGAVTPGEVTPGGDTSGPKKAIYVHWSAGTTSMVFTDYNFAVTGDGVVHENFPDTKSPTHCTRGRNSGTICISAMGAYNFTPACYNKDGILGLQCNTRGQFTDTQINAMRAKINDLKNKWSIPALTHFQAAQQDHYNCYYDHVSDCRWDWGTYTF